MNNENIKNKITNDSEIPNTCYDSPSKKRERENLFVEEYMRIPKKQKNESGVVLEPERDENLNFNQISNHVQQTTNNFSNTNINNNFNLIIQPTISTFQPHVNTSNYNFYNTPTNNPQHNMYLQGHIQNLAYQNNSTYNLYQSISQNNNGRISTVPYLRNSMGVNYNPNLKTMSYLNGITQSNYKFNFLLDSSYLMNKVYSGQYGYNQTNNLKTEGSIETRGDHQENISTDNMNVNVSVNGSRYNLPIINQSNSTRQTQATTAKVSADKQKYIIKDMPELTVANYLQNKTVKSQYLSSIKKKDEENSETNTNDNCLNNNDIVGPKESDNAKTELKTEGNQINSNSEKNNSINSNINSNTNNNSILNFNLNINRHEEVTHEKPSNNIIVQTKSAPPQINKVAINKTINYTTIGNVITFNKQPVANSNIGSNPVNSVSSMEPTTNPKATVGNSPPNAKPQSKQGEFSDSLQKYIQFSFDKCKSQEDRTNCQKALTKIISASLKKGDFNTRDWTNFPLPVFASELKEEIQAKLLKTPVTDTEIKKREYRKGRFDTEYKEKTSKIGLHTDNISANTGYSHSNTKFTDETKTIKIVGTLQTLEKPYLRSTTLPDPSQVRPEHVLVKSLKFLKDKWKKKESDYNYISEQFRSIRQDMTIQHIQNDFTIKVYETHARIALESHDLEQFNQCQTGLISLYEEGLNGNRVEFMAYRIIYSTLQGIKCDMENLLKDIHTLEKKNGLISKNFEISHALRLMKAVNTANYFEFFKLFKITPNMGSYLIEPFLPRLRLKALQVIAMGYYTEVSIAFISDKIAFESHEKCVEYLIENKITLSNDNKKILCKDSLATINNSHLLLMMQLKVTSSA